MDVDVDLLSVHMEMKHGKRKFMLHRKVPVCIFQGLGYHRTFYITPVYKKVLKVAVSSGDHGLSEISGNPQSTFFIIDIQKIGGYIPSVYVINYIFELSASRSAKFLLSVIQKDKCHFRMRKRQMHKKVLDMSRLRHRSL